MREPGNQPVMAPPEAAPESPGGVEASLPSLRHLVIGVALAWVVEIVLGVGLVVRHGMQTANIPPASLVVVTLVSNAWAVGVAWLLLCRRYRRSFCEGFGLARISRRTTGWALTAGVVGAGLALLLSSRFAEGRSFISRLTETPEGWLAFVVIALVMPPFEELYYRGFILPILHRQWGRVAAALLVALWFSGVHAAQLAGDWIGLPILFTMGLLWNVQRLWTGSLSTSLVSHWVYNAVLVTAAALS